MMHVARTDVGRVGRMSNGDPHQVALVLLTTSTTMSCRQYNFSSIKHSDNDPLAPIIPHFKVPLPSLDTFMHSPQQVWWPGIWFLDLD